MVMVMVALQAGRQAQRDRPGHDRVGPHEHHRPPKPGNLFSLMHSRPRPPGAHDDIKLKQQNTNPGCPYRFRLSCRRPDRRPTDTGHHPQSGRAHIRRNSGG